MIKNIEKTYNIALESDTNAILNETSHRINVIDKYQNQTIKSQSCKMVNNQQIC